MVSTEHLPCWTQLLVHLDHIWLQLWQSYFSLAFLTYCKKVQSICPFLAGGRGLRAIRSCSWPVGTVWPQRVNEGSRYRGPGVRIGGRPVSMQSVVLVPEASHLQPSRPQEFCESPGFDKSVYIHLPVILWTRFQLFSSEKALTKNEKSFWAANIYFEIWASPPVLRVLPRNSKRKVKVKSLSCVWLSATPWTVACQVSSVHGILQARTLEWVAIPFSSGSSRPRDRTQVSWIEGSLFSTLATREVTEQPRCPLIPLL